MTEKNIEDQYEAERNDSTPNITDENIDKNGRLKEEIFSYKVGKDNKLFIYWYDKQVMILKGKESERQLAKLKQVDTMGVQLILAKVTGNFKRGNEKLAKEKRK